MKLLERNCDGCGSELKQLGDGDGCGACDAAFCQACLGSTARCPSCQRPFDETREPAAAPPVDALPMDAVDPALARGRRQLIAVGVSVIGSLLLVAALGGTPTTTTFVGQLVVAAALLYQVFRGRAWAKWTFAALAGLVAAGNAYRGLTHVETAGDAWVLSVLLALTYAWCVGVLTLSRPMQKFLQSQRARHR